MRLRNMTAIDATGLRAFEDLADRLHKAGRELILCGAPKQPAALMRQVGVPRARGRREHLPEHHRRAPPGRQPARADDALSPPDDHQQVHLGGLAPRSTHQITSAKVNATATNVSPNSHSVRNRIDCVSMRASSVSGTPRRRSASGCSHTRMLPRPTSRPVL